MVRRAIRKFILATGRELTNPIAWGCFLDSDGNEYEDIDDLFKHRTEGIRGVVLGRALIYALKAFVCWLTWMSTDIRLGIDPQFLKGFLCQSGLDRSVAMAIAFC